MSIEENKAIVRRYFEEGLNRHKFTIVYELLGPDFINHSPRLDTVGREETALDLERFFRAFPDWHTVIEDIVAEGDKVVVRRTISGTHSGDVPGIPMPPTGKRVTFAAWDMEYTLSLSCRTNWLNSLAPDCRPPTVPRCSPTCWRASVWR